MGQALQAAGEAGIKSDRRTRTVWDTVCCKRLKIAFHCTERRSRLLLLKVKEAKHGELRGDFELFRYLCFPI